MKKRKVLLGIIIVVIIYTMAFASKIKRKEGFIGIYPSFNVNLSSNETHGTLYIALGMTVGPFAVPIYMLDRVSSAVYDTVLLPYDYYRLYKTTNGKQVKYYEDENRVEWIGRGKATPLLTDKKEVEYTLKSGNYIGDYIEYYFDGKLKILKKYSDNSILISSYEYYGNQNLKEEIFYFGDGEVKEKKTYSEEGKILLRESYNEKSKFLDKMEYYYNKEKKLEKVAITEKKYLIDKYYDEREKLKSQLKQTISLEKWEGIEETYYKSGKIKGQYIMAEDGVTDIEYSENGEIIKKEICKYKFN